MNSFIKTGEPQVFVCGTALALILVMTLTLAGVVLKNGLGYFWPRQLVQFEMKDGSRLLGEVRATERNQLTGAGQIQIKISNRDLYGQDFKWVSESDVASRSVPEEAILLERMEHGNFAGFLKKVEGEGVEYLRTGSAVKDLALAVEAVREKMKEVAAVRKKMISLNYKIEKRRREIQKLKFRDISANSAAISALEAEKEKLESEFNRINEESGRMEGEARRFYGLFADASGTEKEIALADIIRIQTPNSMSAPEKIGAYFERTRELLLDDPRESNTEGGLFPAIFGTIMMVLLMSCFSLPFGVIAAIYLREYAKEGIVTRMVGIAVNNLAGVPSIVYGIFGLGFFVYGIGGSIDRLFFPERLPTPTFGTGGILWSSLTLALLTVPVVIVATEESLASIPRGIREGSLALGATKFQTLIRLLLPMATPGIMTGMILSMARAAGEVAPLMIVGVVKLAPALPFDGNFPFFHMDRKFMHLGFHIFDVGFQSPNVEAAKPMVYITTLLLLAIVAASGSMAIYLRNRMRKKYTTSHF